VAEAADGPAVPPAASLAAAAAALMATGGGTSSGCSPAAVAAAQGLAAELGLAARFVEADFYAAPAAIPEPASFDRVLVTWGALPWLPDISGWARVVAWFLKPGGKLVLAEGHPAALVFDDAAGTADRPGWLVPYFEAAPVVLEATEDYANPAANLTATRETTWMHPLSAVIGAALVGTQHEFAEPEKPSLEQVRERQALFRHLLPNRATTQETD
jgi:SAM-dependent methyltransferase